MNNFTTNFWDSLRKNTSTKEEIHRVLQGKKVERPREVLGVSSHKTTNFAALVTYNEFTYQREGMTGNGGFLCMRKST